MPQQVFNAQAALPLFELFDWWQPQRLADETGLTPDRVKYLAKLREPFNKHSSTRSNTLASEQQEVLRTFANTLGFAESKSLEKLLPRNIKSNNQKQSSQTNKTPQINNRRVSNNIKPGGLLINYNMFLA